MNKSFYISRRSFLKRCSLAAAATGLPLWFVQREMSAAELAPAITSPNDRPALGLIGCGGMGQGDAENASWCERIGQWICRDSWPHGERG